MDIPILTPRKEWACPNCSLTDETHEAKPHVRMHPCAGLSGITAPMVPAEEVTRGGTRVVAKVREDYVGDELVAYDEQGRPIAAVETQRPDGSNDVAVMAPTAKGKAS